MWLGSGKKSRILAAQGPGPLVGQNGPVFSLLCPVRPGTVLSPGDTHPIPTPLTCRLCSEEVILKMPSRRYELARGLL